MKTLINTDQWDRKEHYLFFSRFEEPFFGVTITIDCTIAYKTAKQKGHSFFLHYLYRALKAANQIENFRYRISNKQVYLYHAVHASTTINRPDNTFGFGYVDYNADEQSFHQAALAEAAQVRKKAHQLLPAASDENYIHFSALPWLNFTGISHARSFSFPDSCPKISFGKVTEQNGVKTMPVSIHVHHALADGYHVGQFAELFQNLMNEA